MVKVNDLYIYWEGLGNVKSTQTIYKMMKSKSAI